MLTKHFIHFFLALVSALTLFFPLMAYAGVITSTDDLPPTTGGYLGSSRHAFYDFLSTLGFVVGIDRPFHDPSPFGVVREPCPPPSPGCDPTMPTMRGYVERETFNSTVSLIIDIGGSIMPFEDADVTAETIVTLDEVDTTTSFRRHYVTELVQLIIDGKKIIGGTEVSLSLQEDPSRASTGETTIIASGFDASTMRFTGPFTIDSFFDVCTELTISGIGPVKSDVCGRVTLVPEPAILALLGTSLGFLGLARAK
jgi:hypothetical protein